ncbi:MAG: type II secretion system GspH family protein [Actinomycetia bacterium]|nr:type II secretion system GspH family protein [Actinomycetes bacterium]
MAALFNKFKCALKKGKDQDGFTLVEVIVALFIISIITGVVIHSTTMALNTSQINQAKTVALNIVNEEIEKIRAMDYQDIGLTGSDPEGILEAQVNTEDGYRVNYNIGWADDAQNYKQISVSAYKQPMVEEVKVITLVFPAVVSTGDEQLNQHPAPYGLYIDRGYDDETVILQWNAPDTDSVVTGYNIYRDYELIGTSLNTGYIDNPETGIIYIYFVTAVYEDGVESGPSEIQST